MGFFRDISSAAKGITGAIKSAGESVYKKVLKPISNPLGKIVSEVGNKAASLEKTVENIGSHVINSGEKIIDGVGRTAENLSQPIFQYIAIGLGVMIAYKVFIEKNK